ncbi:hypothetical protein L2E82_28928 [Cichorium intybus]|uniref:Uncharacterized protein n=1 Tax=Cichorium intybus TaxID=13427 RepID=A0ACB9CX62_CICIN|nr:hypothetical protein L2E82_28928 [Cichorium intybus]
MNWVVFLKDAYGEDGGLIHKKPQIGGIHLVKTIVLPSDYRKLERQKGRIAGVDEDDRVSVFLFSPESLSSRSLMMRLFTVTVVMIMAVSAVSAADPPSPAPMSDATTTYIPTAIASLSALVFAFLF